MSSEQIADDPHHGIAGQFLHAMGREIKEFAMECRCIRQKALVGHIHQGIKGHRPLPPFGSMKHHHGDDNR
jgi:hypothetical protein